MRRFLMKNLSIVLLAALAVGCSQTNPFSKYENPLLLPPNTLCEPNEQLLICSSSDLTECDGYLKDKPILIEETDI